MNNDKIIAACGNDCARCPRHLPQSQSALRETALLWARIGYRDRVVSEEEIACAGCSANNVCRYGIAVCAQAKGAATCAECPDYPCARALKCFRATMRFEMQCRACAAPVQYAALSDAFFHKRENLEARRGNPSP